MKSHTGIYVRTGVSVLLIAILLYMMRGKYGSIVSALQGTHPAVFAMAFVMFTMALAIASFRMKLLIEAQGITINFRETISLAFIGYFFNNFLPTSIGGDVIKAHYLSKHSSDTVGSYTAIFVDRAVGLVTMVFMAFCALLFAGSNVVDERVSFAIYAITATAFFGILFLANKSFARRFSALTKLVKPLESKLKKLYDTVNRYRHRPGLMLMTFLISVVSQLFYFTCFGFLALSIGSRIPAFELFLKMPIVSMMSLLPSINGLGVREGATVVLFGPTIGRGNAVAISILMLVILLMTSVIGGLIYAVSPQFRMKLKEIEKEGGIA
ncbi:MAG: flippase-like domain-containing protein [Candidatus Omnitrophica bacterium]|nr:flippase-like domain-containing protein [Candidatus Omnitrophota bacterium]